jgi:hypothetical protein
MLPEEAYCRTHPAMTLLRRGRPVAAVNGSAWQAAPPMPARNSTAATISGAPET